MHEDVAGKHLGHEGVDLVRVRVRVRVGVRVRVRVPEKALTEPLSITTNFPVQDEAQTCEGSARFGASGAC